MSDTPRERLGDGSSDEAPTDPTIRWNEPGTGDPPRRIGPYLIIEQIGRGGFGVVYKAEQQTPVRRIVALKTLLPGIDMEQVITRFDAERQALALMEHPGIARVFDAGESDTGLPYFVMEYVPGIPITEHCDKHKLGTRDRLLLFVESCRAVQHAHQKGVVHRDIKPTNVLVAHGDEGPYVKVIDFGVAKALHQPLTAEPAYTRAGQIIGTPQYMSPEQADRDVRDLDTRTDVYSLGVLLYELLTGSRPFDSKRLSEAALAEVLRIIREEDPEKPSTRLSRVDGTRTTGSGRPMARTVRGDLDWITMKALEKNRNRRYDSASSFAEDIERHLRDETIEAGRPGVAYRTQKFVRRHRALVSAVSVIAVVLAAATAFSARMAARAMTAEGEARFEARTSNLLAVQSLLERGKATDARAILDGMPEDERGWVWQHLRLRTDDSIGRAGGFQDLASVATNEASPFVVTLTKSGVVEVWSNDLRSRRTLPGASAVSIAMAPDGRRLALLGAKPEVHVIALDSNEVTASFGGQWTGLAHATWLPDGSTLLCSTRTGDENNLLLLDPEAATSRSVPLAGRARSIAVSPDGERVVYSTHSDSTVRVIQLDGTSIMELSAFEAGADVSDVDVSADGAWIVAATQDGRIRRWRSSDGSTSSLDARRGGWILKPLDDGRLLSGADDHSIRLIDFAAKQDVAIFNGLTGRATSIAHAGSKFYAASPHEIMRFDLERSDTRWSSADISSTATMADGSLVIGLEDGRVGLFDGEAFRLDRHFNGRQARVAISDDGRTRAVLTRGENESNILVLRLRGSEHTEAFEGACSVAVPPNGDRAYLINGNTLRSWNNVGPPIETEMSFSPFCIGASNDLVVVGGIESSALDDEPRRPGRAIALVLNSTGAIVSTHHGDVKTLITAVRLLPDGRLVIGDNKGVVKVLHIGSTEPIWTNTPQQFMVWSLDVHDNLLLVGATSGAISLLQLEDGRKLITLQSERSELDDVHFSPDGSSIVGYDAGGVRFWRSSDPSR